MPVQLRAFLKSPVRIVYLQAIESPCSATYTLWIEERGGAWLVCKESGRGGRASHRQAWLKLTFEEATKLYEKTLHEKTRSQKGRQYRVVVGGEVK